VTDTLPSTVTFVSASSSQGTCTNASGTVTCTIGNLANAASSTITINVTTPATSGPITNSATVGGNETDSNTANNTPSASTQVSTTTGGSADLSITKYAFAGFGDRNQFQVGKTFYYVLRVTNAGPNTATGVKVTDHLPAGLTFRWVFATNHGTCSQVAGTVTCGLGTLKKGSSAWVAIAVTPTAAGSITNTATVSGNQSDPNMKNNSSSVTITVAKADSCDGDNNANCHRGNTLYGWNVVLGGLRSGLHLL
jgi:uncharacterized repeat protein (TIGR01451 family)